MLSRPPPSLARRTSSAAASDGSSSRRSALVIWSVPTSLKRPSLHRRHAVAGHGVDRPEIDVDGLVHAEHPGDDVALRMDLRLLGGDPPVAHEVGHHAVVLGELHERAVAEEVRAAVADVGDDELLGRPVLGVGLVRIRFVGHEREGDDRRAHPSEVGVGVALVADPVVRHGDRLFERIGGGLVVRDLQGLDGELRRHLTALVPAHPVGDHEEGAIGEEHVGVLVDRAQPPDVGGGAGPQDDAAHEPSSRTVLPIWSLSPRWICIGPVTLRRFR